MSNSNSNANGPLVVGLGEVLFDCFPDRRVLGGAPVNVAVHAQQLLAPRGGRGCVVSRVGNDDLGREIIGQLSERGLDVGSIQVDQQRPTGTVQVTLVDGEPDYEIVTDVAWDAIEFSDALAQLAGRCDAVCYGTLAQRAEPSRGTIQRFLAAAKSAVRMFDVNFRQQFYSREILRESLQSATVVKLNEAELAEIDALLGDDDMADGEDDVDRGVARLQDRYQLQCVALTRGSRGTVLYRSGEKASADPPVIERAADADSVGAGDAAAAGLVYGLLQDWPTERILDLSNRMGAYVASQSGATPTLPEALIEFAA